MGAIAERGEVRKEQRLGLRHKDVGFCLWPRDTHLS